MSGLEYMILGAAIVIFLVGTSLTSRKRQKQKIQNMIREGFASRPSREYTEEELRRIARYYERSRGEGFSLDDITWNDLELDSLFGEVNQTWSSVGESVLYRMLRTPVFEEETLKERDRVLCFMAEHETERNWLWEQFARLGRTKKVSLWDYIDNFTDLELKGGFMHWVYDLCLVVSVLLAVWKPDTLIVLPVICTINNLVQYYRKKAEVEHYFACIDYVLLLVRFGEKIGQKKIPELEPYLKTLREAVKPLASIKGKALLIGDSVTFSAGLEQILLDYLRMLTHIDLIAFGSVLRQVKKYGREIEILAETLGFLEACIALASYRETLPYYTVPELHRGKGADLLAEELYHPSLERGVPNSITADRCILVTGSNASGKSTFLKAVAICAILAQTAATVPARAYRANYYRIYSSMALRDHLASQESYFVVEIKSLKRILDSVEEEIPVLCFVDEVLRGTNTVERIAASAQILDGLAEENVLCFAATHDVELTRLLEASYTNYHFTEEVSEDDVRFSYRLQPGPAASRNAIRLLKAMGYADGVTQAAEETAARFLETGQWSLKEDKK